MPGIIDGLGANGANLRLRDSSRREGGRCLAPTRVARGAARVRVRVREHHEEEEECEPGLGGRRDAKQRGLRLCSSEVARPPSLRTVRV
eukprot:3031537-Rhodomonas_salina.1